MDVTTYYFNCMKYVKQRHEWKHVSQQERNHLDQYTIVK